MTEKKEKAMAADTTKTTAGIGVCNIGGAVKAAQGSPAWELTGT